MPPPRLLISDPYKMSDGITKTHEFGFASLFIDDVVMGGGIDRNYGGYYGSPGWNGGGYGGGDYGWGGERGYWPGGWHYNTIVNPGVSSEEGKTTKGVNDWIDKRTEQSRALKAEGKVPGWMPETQGQ